MGGCNKEPPSASESAKNDYDKAKTMIENGSFGKANIFLEHYTTNHPYSAYAPRAEILRVYAAYRNSEYVLSETLATRFITSHPRHPDVAYARYLEAMSNAKQVGSADRDTAPIKRAIESFDKLLHDYPESIYSKDILPRMQQLRNKLAKRELVVGKYYFDRDRFVAAAKRFKVILDEYQTSPVIEEALYYLSMSYHELHIDDSAHEVALLLKHNYPKSDWSQKLQGL
ncbi:MAG: hypothetical protein AUJ56_00420 [Zetaproteobacteria bacterium CG1_02_49_23]|nr:MAG: hypothetical protein AUJ56_00420 [Zetaproteobacteria bacterium CG1_02_49_23]